MSLFPNNFTVQVLKLEDFWVRVLLQPSYNLSWVFIARQDITTVELSCIDKPRSYKAREIDSARFIFRLEKGKPANIVSL